MRKHKTVIFLTIGFLVGICILLYPAFSDFWNSKTQSRAVTNYESVLENLDEDVYKSIFENAYAYNKALYENNYPLKDYKKVPGYYETLSITEKGKIFLEQAKHVLEAFHTLETTIKNPNYDESLEYISRDKRKEWCKVGIIGQIIVRQDGTLVSGGFAGCKDGIATKSDKGYRVIKVVDDTVAIILVK